MQRRRYLATAVMTLAAGFAGCVDDSEEEPDVDDEEAVKTVVRDYTAAFGEGDRSQLEALTHTDSPDRESVDGMTDQELDDLSTADFSVELGDVTVEDDTAFVDSTLRVSSGEQSTSVDQEVELRRHDGDWRIWDAD